MAATCQTAMDWSFQINSGAKSAFTVNCWINYHFVCVLNYVLWKKEMERPAAVVAALSFTCFLSKKQCLCQ